MTAAQFTLDEAKARGVLDGLALTPDDWTAAHDPDGAEVDLLVTQATEQGAISCPPGVTVKFLFEDGEPAYYRWLLDISKPVSVQLVSHGTDMALLGGGKDVRGPDSAVAVLTEAVRDANSLLACLDAYVREVTGR